MNIFCNTDINFLSLITTIATVIIALCALFLSYWQLRALSRHNKLSIKPLITFEVYSADFENGFGIYIRNSGIGPAIVKDFKILIDSTEIIAERPELWKKAAEKLLIDYNTLKIFTLFNNFTIPAGKRFPMLTAESNINPDLKKLFIDAIPRVNIIVHYKSIYNESFIERLDEVNN
jgi:hypothetical protein